MLLYLLYGRYSNPHHAVLLSPLATDAQAGEEGRQQGEALEKRLAQSQAAAWQKDLTLEPLGSTLVQENR